jgi:hypothetical protein
MVRIAFANGWQGWASIAANSMLLIPLAALLVLSIVWMSGLLRWKYNTRVSGKATQNSTIEMSVYIATYIVPMIWIETNLTGLLVSIVLFGVVGVVFIRSDKDYLNPTFQLFGYKSYIIDNKVVLVRASLDALNISLTENPQGISARELVRNMFIVLRR